MKESHVQAQIRLACRHARARLFRNHRGKVKCARTGVWHEFGLAPGASDLIGWTEVTVTPDMVGEQVAVFTAIEVKRSRGARRTPEQRKFVERVRLAGGRSGFAWSVEQALALLRGTASDSAE